MSQVLIYEVESKIEKTSFNLVSFVWREVESRKHIPRYTVANKIILKDIMNSYIYTVIWDSRNKVSAICSLINRYEDKSGGRSSSRKLPIQIYIVEGVIYDSENTEGYWN